MQKRLGELRRLWTSKKCKIYDEKFGQKKESRLLVLCLGCRKSIKR